jgi:signal transduction histidine kinase
MYDAARLERVFANVIANAIKYSPSGSPIFVDIARQPGDDNSWAVVAIRDQGIGIPAADLPFIFERFHRAGNVAQQIQGTGIGLSSTRQIVEQHGGTIDVASQEGVGSTFTVRLPL